MSVDIIKIENTKSIEFQRFYRLPFNIYKDSKNWVPWFYNDVKSFVDRNHPIFEHTEGEFYIATMENRTVGRVFVFENRNYNKTHNANRAHFSFLDLADDREIIEKLFDTVMTWSKNRGLDGIQGPMGFGGITGGGVLIKGFQYRAAMTMMNYNFPYYSERLEEVGFKKFLDNFNFYLLSTATLPPQLREASDQLLAKGEVKVLNIQSGRQLGKIADELVHVFMKTLSKHPGNYVLSDNELNHLAKNLVRMVDPKLIKIVTYNDKVIGFLFCFADISAAIQKSKGHLTPMAAMRLKKEFKKTDWLLINGIGILPDYQGIGANAVLYSEVEKILQANKNFKHIEMVQIAESTAKMLKNVTTLQGKAHKTHRIFEYNF